MKTYSFGEDTKKAYRSSRTPGLNIIRTFSIGMVVCIAMLAITLSIGCGGDGDKSGGSTSDLKSKSSKVSEAQGKIDPKWPGDKLPKSVPPIAGAKVLSSMQDGDDLGVVFMCKKSEIEAYIQHLEQIGWIIDKDVGSDGDNELGAISRFLSNDEGEHLQISWQSGGGTGTLGYSKE